jgi:DNA polymerase-1
MHHIIFEDNLAEDNEFPVALLIKPAALKKKDLASHYEFKERFGLDNVIAFDLDYGGKKKPTAATRKEYLGHLLKALDSLGTKFLYVCDAEYFKTLAGKPKAEPNYGYSFPCNIKGYEHMQVILGTNYQSLIYNPMNEQKLTQSLNTLQDAVDGVYIELGTELTNKAQKLYTKEEIIAGLEEAAKHDALTCDIETFDLKFYKAGIATITFCWNTEEGIVFPVDYVSLDEPEGKGKNIFYGKQVHNPEIKEILKEFFETYSGDIKFVYHNAGYDIKVLIYELWMGYVGNREGMLEGLEVMTKSIGDTKLIRYLATNSCAGNKLSLKDTIQEWAGNYAQEDIKDVRKIPLEGLLDYNFVDGCGTWHAHDKHYPEVISDEQEDIYLNLFIPAVKNLLQMELTGIPLNIHTVYKAKRELQAIEDEYVQKLKDSPIIQDFNWLLRESARDAANAKLKVKVKPIEDFLHVEFNSGSPKQVGRLLHEVMDYPIIDLTDTKEPATGNKTLKKHIANSSNEEYKEVLENIVEIQEVSKILSTFIKAFLENSAPDQDGWYWLFGNFNLGGTVSGRLSSSQPNLQNIPSGGTKYAKIIKKCIECAPGWLWVGADFASLEDRISALTTKDSNKLKIYLENYDGHCLKAYHYWPHLFPDIEDTVESINSIKVKYPDIRDASKSITFLLTYAGTHHGLMQNCGFPEAEAKAIEANYHTLFVESDQWVQSKLIQASEDGYVTVAFGLRVRTPVLEKTVLGNSYTPSIAKGESRTAGNALGQSYGLLNTRAGIEVQERTLQSEHRLAIFPCAHIHDAQYFVIKEDISVVSWLNNNLVECMEWQELPEIQHPEVKLGGELDIFFPTWADAITIPNNSSYEEIINVCHSTEEK